MADSTKLLETFRDARSQDTNWEKLVRALDRLEATSPTDQQGRSWAKVAAQLSGYSVNQIRQMQRTLATLEALQSRGKQPSLTSTLHRFPYSHLEMLARIAKIDPDWANKHLRSDAFANRQPTYRELRDQYYKLREKTPQQSSAIAAGMKTSRQFENLCLELLMSNHAEPLYRSQVGASKERRITRWPGAFRYASPDLLIEGRGDNQASEVDAADCFTVYGDIKQEETIRRIQRIAFEASFFTTFWIMLPTWSPGELFESECKTLQLRNVGIVAVDSEKRAIARVTAPTGPPVPDRRQLLQEAVTTYLRLK